LGGFSCAAAPWAVSAAASAAAHDKHRFNSDSTVGIR
jgi:hypothetical protein